MSHPVTLTLSGALGRRRRTPIRLLLMGLVLACLAPGLIGVGVMLYRMQQDDRAQTAASTTRTARAIVLALDAELARARSVANSLATSTHLLNGDLPGFHARARALLRVEDVGASVELIDAEGRILVNTLREPGEVLPQRTDPARLRELFDARRPKVSDIYTNATSGQLVTTLDVPVIDQGRVKYSLSLVLPPERLGALLRRQQLPEDWIIGISDRNGLTVARSSQAERFVGKLAGAELLRRLPQAAEGSFEASTREGIPAVIAYSRSPASEWTVAIGIPAQSLSAPWRATIGWLVGGVTLLFALGAAVAWRMGGRIARSVQRLSDAALAMTGHDARSAPMTEDHFAEAHVAAEAISQGGDLLIRRKLDEQALLEALRDSKARLDAALASMSDAVCISDAEGRLIDINPAFASFYRFADDAACLKSFAEYPGLFHVEFADGGTAPVDQWAVPSALRGETGSNVEFKLRRDDTGESWYGSFSYAPIRAADGSIVGSVVSARDITVRKEREQALVDVQARLALAQLAGNAGLWEWDIEKGTNAWTEPMFQLLGLDSAHCTASFDAWLKAIHPDDREAAAQATELALQNREPLRWSCRVVMPGGEVRWIDTIGTAVFDDDGRPLRMSGICIDTTERHLAAEELRRHRERLEELVAERTAELGIAKDAAERANRSKSAFLANMSHEIRTPMNAIIGLTHLMARDTRDALQRDSLRKVDGAARHLLQVINDILDLSKIEAGKMVLDDVEFSLDDLLARAFEMVSEAAGATRGWS
jgi:PAS domain-containing protein